MEMMAEERKVDQECLGEAAQTPVSYVSLLRHNRSFRRLWCGLAVSMAGDWFRIIALYHLVLELTGASGLALGGILIAQSLSMFLLSPVAGVLADRLSRKAIMIGTDLIRAGLTLGFLCITTADRVWLAYVLTAVIMAVSSFFSPALMATLPNLTRREELVAANALTSATWAAMLAIGSGLGGLVTAALGTSAAFGIDAATYVISALFIASISISARTSEASEAALEAPHSGWQAFVSGLHYMKDRPLIRQLLSVKAWSAGVGGSIVLLSTLFAENVFQAGVIGMGLVYTVRGIGAVFGPMVARRIVGENPDAMYRTIGVAFFIMAGLFLLFSRMPTLLSASVVLCAATMASNILWVFSSTLLQLSVPDAYRGRVFATDFALLTILMAASTFIAGWAVDQPALGPRTVTALFGGILFIPALLWLFSLVRQRSRAFALTDKSS
jgi:predicted MFS family arabinose efflux permease